VCQVAGVTGRQRTTTAGNSSETGRAETNMGTFGRFVRSFARPVSSRYLMAVTQQMKLKFVFRLCSVIA